MLYATLEIVAVGIMTCECIFAYSRSSIQAVPFDVSMRAVRRGLHAQYIIKCSSASLSRNSNPYESLWVYPHPTRQCRTPSMWAIITSDQLRLFILISWVPGYTHLKGVPKVVHLALVARQIMDVSMKGRTQNCYSKNHCELLYALNAATLSTSCTTAPGARVCGQA